VADPRSIYHFGGIIMRTLWDLFSIWGPVALLIGVWLFFMRRYRGTLQNQQEYTALVKTYVTEHLAETQQINKNLQRIADALERRQV
jgi:hypothetical protein